MTRIVGMPRKRSAYTVANSRSGKNTGPGRPRRIARKRAKTRMKTSAIRKILTLTKKALAMSGNESAKTSRLRKDCLTSGQPGARTTSTTTTLTTTSVLSAAMTIARRPLPPGDAVPMMREPLLPVRVLPQVRGAGLREVRPLQFLHRSVRPQAVERPVHALDERVVLLEHHAEVLARPALRELADDGSVVELHCDDVEGRRQVDHDPVDLPAVERGYGVVVRVVDRGGL